METTIIIALLILLIVCVGTIIVLLKYFEGEERNYLDIIWKLTNEALEPEDVTVDEFVDLLRVVNAYMTQAEIAKALWVSQSAVSRWNDRQTTSQLAVKKHYKKLTKLV